MGVAGLIYNSFIPFFQTEDAKRKNKRKTKEVKPLLDKLSSLLDWVEEDGQSASQAKRQSVIEEIKESVSFINSFIALLGHFTQ